MAGDDQMLELVRDWRALAARYRVAQGACDKNSDEWWLNKECADLLEDCADSLDKRLRALTT